MQWTQVRRKKTPLSLAHNYERQFPHLGAKPCGAKERAGSVSDSFLKTLVAKNPMPKPKAAEPEVPLGWLRMCRDGSRAEHPGSVKARKDGEEAHRKKTTVEAINKMLRMRQQERDIQNELLGAMSPYYDAWDITGPPGASDAEYSDDEPEDYSSEDS